MEIEEINEDTVTINLIGWDVNIKLVVGEKILF